ncbi:hypothetical protein KP509_26G066500 [Ceratopteris richardii]|uniref:HTH La-type RNA-binding domain-containing protein n=1 Tax=Ceratopteris richardii TaxID=49495 RepID=A0A8T2RMT7_CERRI|nr:hypothetical protein KP509_26G066500 [Ceratopteris richardii]KAH7297360.1 hypothetical protein KP509_26G066500 [Ceratopteris richardii]
MGIVSATDMEILDAAANSKQEVYETQRMPCYTAGRDNLARAFHDQGLECITGSAMPEEVGNIVESSLSHESQESPCLSEQANFVGTVQDQVDATVNVQVPADVDACDKQMDILSLSADESSDKDFKFPGKGAQNRGTRLTEEPNVNISCSTDGNRGDQISVALPPRKQKGWSNPASPEPEFMMEASSWPTLAEARHAKPSQVSSSIPKREETSLTSPLHSVPSSQENVREHTVEISKHTQANRPVPGPKFRSTQKKGGFPKPIFMATENMPVSPVPGHVPNPSMVVPDQPTKGTGFMGMNNFYLPSQQAAFHSAFHYPRADVLPPIPYNPTALSSHGQPGWQHNGRGYNDVSFRYAGFMPQYGPQMYPQYMQPVGPPYVNTNVTQYSYPSYQGDMSSTVGFPAHGFSFGRLYDGPSQTPSGPAVRSSLDTSSLQHKLRKQIEYYFSVENLCHDTYLTSRMDDEGFVPISLIASFPRVKKLTLDTSLILEAMKKSTLVEVKNGKIRANDWRRWKPILSGTSDIQAIQKGNLLGSLSYIDSGNLVDREVGSAEAF